MFVARRYLYSSLVLLLGNANLCFDLRLALRFVAVPEWVLLAATVGTALSILHSTI